MTNWVKNGGRKTKELKRCWNSQRLFLAQFSRTSCLMSGIYKTLKENWFFAFLSVKNEHQKLRSQSWLRVRRSHAQFPERGTRFSLACLKRFDQLFNHMQCLFEWITLSARLFWPNSNNREKTKARTDCKVTANLGSHVTIGISSAPNWMQLTAPEMYRMNWTFNS